MEDQQPGTGDLTTGTEDTRSRRWGFLRRRRKDPVAGPEVEVASESEPESADATGEDDQPARRTPVGKAQRTRPGAEPDEPAKEDAGQLAAETDAAETDAAETDAAEIDAAETEAAETEAAEIDAAEPEAAETGAAETEAEPEAAETEAAETEAEPEAAETEAAETEAESDAAESDTEPDSEPDAAESEPVLVEHRPAGRRLLIVATAASVLFVAAAGFAGASLQPYLEDRALVHIKMDVARTATDAVTALWSYTPENMESLPNRAAKYLAGDFATEYRRYIDAIVAANKQAEVTNTTQVMGAAVESISPTEATAIVYTNSVSTSPVTKNIPSLRYLAYKLEMERRGAEWLITRMSAITKLDLTPQL